MPPNHTGANNARATICHRLSLRAAWSPDGLLVVSLDEYLTHVKLAKKISQSVEKIILKSVSFIAVPSYRYYLAIYLINKLNRGITQEKCTQDILPFLQDRKSVV